MLPGWLVGLLIGWLVGRWFVYCLFVNWMGMVDWLAGWLGGWLVACLLACLLA